MTALATAVRGHVPMVIMAGETSMGAAYHNQRIDQARNIPISDKVVSIMRARQSRH
jgi:thiamine pyrophosphate-dependent acetolactate synthase large subunit-like protein